MHRYKRNQLHLARFEGFSCGNDDFCLTTLGKEPGETINRFLYEWDRNGSTSGLNLCLLGNGDDDDDDDDGDEEDNDDVKPSSN